VTSPNQFGFKKGSGWDFAIYSVTKVVEHFVAGGSTVNVCLLDLSKAFDKMDHSALYLKLMDRSIPVQILNVLQNWFSLCMSCVKWGSVMSHFYELKAGVRQGGVLSPIVSSSSPAAFPLFICEKTFSTSSTSNKYSSRNGLPT